VASSRDFLVATILPTSSPDPSAAPERPSDEPMATSLPKAELGVEMKATRISVEPPSQLPMAPSDLPMPSSELPTPSSRRPYGPGDIIDGKYELEALLGKGGMGEVWTARNTTLDVRRAVKLIRADTDSSESTDRLLYEAQAAARLAEPSIVRVFDFGKTDFGDPYIVMEMLEGEDLMSVIRRRERLSPAKAVRVLLPVIRALVAAHTHGIVHRDLKPENIFLAKLPDGRVQPKLLDFGIAKLKNARELRLTTAGAVMGSPLYMAPEQARGEDVDERADIWAICVVLYESITGNTPFSGDDRAEVMRAAADLDPPRLSQCGVQDDSLWPILIRGLAKKRDERWSSMEELGRALARWLLDGGAVDDVTGASLEASWFRSSRQSLFASSSPPKPPRFTLLGVPGVQRSRVGRALLTHLRMLPFDALGWVRSLRTDARSRRFGAVLMVSLGAAFAMLWILNEPEGAAAPPPAPAEPNAELELSTEPNYLGRDAFVGSMPPLAEAPVPLAEASAPPAPTEPAKLENADTTNRRPATSEGRPRRRAAETGARERSKEHRRSKLIDPYE
jgi:serine/threonine-protein kinase